ncbi:hypothetical protein LI328DRAFT_147698 [Trichoderma asperelloides]|nr:hypothetical protein LI328DRAFT_147698 [Trichoderma asperelloides]
MCFVDRITYLCTHIENVYTDECEAPGKRCAKHITPRTSDSVQRIIEIIEEQKSNALVELELKIAIEVAKKKADGEEFAEGSGGGWI